MEKKYPFSESRKRSLGRSERMETKRRHLHVSDTTSESDKDSGFSDGSSESLGIVEQMDLEDGLTTPYWNGALVPQQNPAMMSSPFPALPSLFVMKNILIEQVKNVSPKIESWSVQPSIEMIPAPSQLVFLQSAVPSTTSPCSATGKKANFSSYLPRLKSYTKIAPHPSKKSSGDRNPSSPLDEKRSCDVSSKQKLQAVEKCKMDVPDIQNIKNRPSKSLESETLLSWTSKTTFTAGQDKFSPAAIEGTGVTSGGFQCLVDSPLQKALAFSERCQDGHLLKPTPLSLEANLSSVDQLTSGQPFPAEDTRADTEGTLQQSKKRRFQNTLDILHKSGLLGITLKTKELARRNQASQNELDLLKEQTVLFLKAAQSRDPELQARLLMSMSMSSNKTGVATAEHGENPSDATSEYTQPEQCVLYNCTR